MKKKTHAVLPDIGFVRLTQIVGKPKANPPIPGVIPIGASSWWAGVKDGRFPKPVKIGPHTTAWLVQDIVELVSKIADKEAA